MSLQGPIIVVAEQPAIDIVEALRATGALPIVETKWVDAPTAFVAVKPAAVVIAEPGPPPTESSARMLSLQLATVNDAIVPAIARVLGQQEAAIPNALPADAMLPAEHMVMRLRAAQRVRALHATVLRRIESYASESGALPPLPTGDALEEATVLIAGRGPLYPALSVAIGERVNMIGTFSAETAAQHLNTRDIDGLVVGDGFSPRTVEALLTVLGQDSRFRDLPVAVIGKASLELAENLPNIDFVDGDPEQLVPRIVPPVRLHAFEARLKRMLASLKADGMYDPQTGLLTRDAFWRDLRKAVAEASDRSQALSMARFTFDGPLAPRASSDAARLLARLIRNIDFAMHDGDGALLVVFTQTGLRSAHVVVRRIAGALKSIMTTASGPREKLTANVTLATLKAGDTIDSLMQRVTGSQVVAAE